MIPARYRSDYDGEFVITNTIFKDGKKEQEREWVDNPIQNNHMNRATCLANGSSIEKFNIKSLEDHKGGLCGIISMQVYGVENIYKQLKCNFLVSLNQDTLDNIKDINYQENTIVYTSARLCIRNQGDFFLIPHGVRLTPHATAVWLACFDGHEEIFLFGYDEFDEVGGEITGMVKSVNEVITAYPNVKFTHVVKNDESPDLWKYNLNFKTISVREYINYCDV